VVALGGVVLLVLLYVVTLIAAIVDNSSSGKFFALCLCCTLVVPIIIFLYSWMYGRLTGNKTIGDPEDPEIIGINPGGSSESSKKEETR
jgi:dolichyl-phosphate-mannose--protein O-mannosyl transferase